MPLSALEKMEAKYDEQEQASEIQEPEKDRAELTSWKDSEPVKELSAFIKEYRTYGFSLQQTQQGKPVLDFNPGLEVKGKDPERFELAEHLVYLMDQARLDLQELIFNGLLTFPENRTL